MLCCVGTALMLGEFTTALKTDRNGPSEDGDDVRTMTRLCLDVSRICPEGYTCIRAGVNPNYGYTSYDSFGWPLLSLFRMMTQDFWENLVMLVSNGMVTFFFVLQVVNVYPGQVDSLSLSLSQTLRAAGKSYLFFFMLLVSPGLFCLLSLVVAMSAVASSEQEEANFADAKQKEEEFNQIVEVLKKREEDEVRSFHHLPHGVSHAGS